MGHNDETSILSLNQKANIACNLRVLARIV